ncbi:MAG: rhodanese-like domain-containing protein [Gammaproteobacteria bacterium]
MAIEAISPVQLKQMMDDKVDFMLIDVREPDEFAICNLGGTLIPLNTLPSKLAELDKEKYYVVHCKLGGRSQRAAEVMKAAGFQYVANLVGGIDAWAKTIDTRMPTY